ncbi:MAG TPA: hypothetical protein VIS06_05965 [Mycobacteriales bacterium]
MRTVKITNANRVDGEVSLDGESISDAVRGLTLTMCAGDIPTLTLDVVADVLFDGQTDVVIPEETRALLVRLGWTPPKG